MVAAKVNENGQGKHQCVQYIEEGIFIGSILELHHEPQHESNQNTFLFIYTCPSFLSNGNWNFQIDFIHSADHLGLRLRTTHKITHYILPGIFKTKWAGIQAVSSLQLFIKMQSFNRLKVVVLLLYCSLLECLGSHTLDVFNPRN